MQQVSVYFQDERLDLDVPEDKLVTDWKGPGGVETSEYRRKLLEALESPRDYPALRLAVVPGDRVAIALDPEIPEVEATLEVVTRILREAGVETGDINVVVPQDAKGRIAPLVPEGVVLTPHDPDDREGLAYLSATSNERRVYLNRIVTDADFVLPIGRLGYDRVFGYRGPWSALSPGLSDTDAIKRYRAIVHDEPSTPEKPRPQLAEAAEVSWLLGSQFHVGIVPAATGALDVVAGLESAVREQGSRAVDSAWRLEVPEQADLVVVGIGAPGQAADLDQLADGLATAARLVQRGGKIAVLSKARGDIGPALKRLIDADDPRVGISALRGREADPDYPAAVRLAKALAWADVFLHSGLDRDVAEDLSMIPIDRPEEVKRLVATSASCLFVSQADQVEASVDDENA
ncbi:lactate racemase domain-containing protein [Singulisphaera sp. PoT]|uniref:lactate racemase domain-containing protein n=1 Tax=Singulisphaera sp. PoT TaxID=3411797 RepID=UPI003BF4DC86